MSLVLLGSTSGSVTLQEPAIAGSTVIDLPATSGTMAVTSGSPSFTNITATGNLTVNGNTTLGDASTDTILMTGAPSIGGAGLGMGMGFRNRIINGAMVIDQRNAGAEVNPVVNATYYLDRWVPLSTQTSKLKIKQNAGSVTPPVGHINYLGLTSLSAYSVTATDVFEIRQNIEGLNVADLGWGAAGAATVTLSFWVYSSLTGTFGGALQNSAYNRSYPFTFTISAANTWEQKTITIAGDTTGTWLTTNGIGVRVVFGLGVGSTYSGTAGAWAGTEYHSATGATSVVGTNGATFYITGVQLEKGSTATSFDYRPYGTELALCQRYYARLQAGTSAYTGFGSGLAYSTTNATIFIKYPVTMRSSPSLSGANLGFNDGLVSNAVTAINASYLGTDSGIHQFTSSGLTQYRPYILAGNNSTSAYIDLSSEL
jgi:hypothetical protein